MFTVELTKVNHDSHGALLYGVHLIHSGVDPLQGRRLCDTARHDIATRAALGDVRCMLSQAQYLDAVPGQQCIVTDVTTGSTVFNINGLPATKSLVSTSSDTKRASSEAESTKAKDEQLISHKDMAIALYHRLADLGLSAAQYNLG
jgi:hypothetical protein